MADFLTPVRRLPGTVEAYDPQRAPRNGNAPPPSHEEHESFMRTATAFLGLLRRHALVVLLFTLAVPAALIYRMRAFARRLVVSTPSVNNMIARRPLM